MPRKTEESAESRGGCIGRIVHGPYIDVTLPEPFRKGQAGRIHVSLSWIVPVSAKWQPRTNTDPRCGHGCCSRCFASRISAIRLSTTSFQTAANCRTFPSRKARKERNHAPSVPWEGRAPARPRSPVQHPVFRAFRAFRGGRTLENPFWGIPHAPRIQLSTVFPFCREANHRHGHPCRRSRSVFIRGPENGAG